MGKASLHRARSHPKTVPTGGAANTPGNTALLQQTSRVSPNGEWLAFMSDRPLTGYDNVDANSGARDEEVYEYHYGSSAPVCVSCNPNGERPVGVLDTQAAGEGQGLIVDRPDAWETSSSFGEFEGIDGWLAGSVPGWTGIGDLAIGPFHQPRYLSNSGRLFFNSADALVPLAKPARRETIGGNESEVGAENVYEYEPQHLGSCTTDNTTGGCVELISSGESETESAFLDASENGEDVFFLTAAKLSPLDPDTTFDVYDARVCGEGGAEPCPTPPPVESEPCSGEGAHNCRPPSGGAQVFAAPASSTPSGSGNVVPKAETPKPKVEVKGKKETKLTHAQLLAKALKTCRTKYKAKSKAHKRHACEQQARKKYPVKSKKKKAGAKS